MCNETSAPRNRGVREEGATGQREERDDEGERRLRAGDGS
jgi:hypothetical protein